MKKSLTSSVVLAALGLASLTASAMAAPKHRAPFAGDTSYQQTVMPPVNAVVSEGKVVGVDPDPNIRTQLIHDPDPSGF